MSKLHFLTGGIPHTTKPRNTLNGIKRAKELGIDGMELEWVHSIPFKEDDAKKVRQMAQKLGMQLTVHGSYYINLASTEPQKWHASISRITSAARMGSIAGAKKLTFHGAFYQGRDSVQVGERVQSGLEKVLEYLHENNIEITIAPELTGKISQFGTLEELISLAEKLPIKFCIDFSHLHARSGGKYNSQPEFRYIFTLIRKHLGKQFLKDMYFHLSGILYAQSGERRHVCLLESEQAYAKEGIFVDGWSDVALREVDFIKGGADIQWRSILETLKEFDVGGHLVCESPNLEQDAILLKRYYEAL